MHNSEKMTASLRHVPPDEDRLKTTLVQPQIRFLPSVPLTHDPVQLLAYIMDMSPLCHHLQMEGAHLRVQNTALQAQLDEAQLTNESLSRSCAESESKRKFIERYANSIVQDRNRLLHSGKDDRNRQDHHLSPQQQQHFHGHMCCQKNAHVVNLDTLPSLATLRGQTLEQVQQELRETQARYREAHVALGRLTRHQAQAQAQAQAQRQLVQLERDEGRRQLAQRLVLMTTLERRLATLRTQWEHERLEWNNARVVLETQLEEVTADLSQASQDVLRRRENPELRAQLRHAREREVGTQVEREQLLARIAQLEATQGPAREVTERYSRLLDETRSALERQEQKHREQVSALRHEVEHRRRRRVVQEPVTHPDTNSRNDDDDDDDDGVRTNQKTMTHEGISCSSPGTTVVAPEKDSLDHVTSFSTTTSRSSDSRKMLTRDDLMSVHRENPRDRWKDWFEEESFIRSCHEDDDDDDDDVNNQDDDVEDSTAPVQLPIVVAQRPPPDQHEAEFERHMKQFLAQMESRRKAEQAQAARDRHWNHPFP